MVAFAESVDFFVDLSTVVVSFLTSTSNGELHTTWMPCTNTGNLAQTLVRLPGQFLRVPTAGHTLESTTFSYTYNVDHLVLVKNLLDCNWLFKVLPGEVDFLRDSATIELDFHDVGLLLALLHQAGLRVDKNSDNRAVLLDMSKVLVNILSSDWVLPLLRVLGECLLLRSVPL